MTWGIAGYLSHRPSQTTAVQGLTAILGVLGLLAPMLVAAALVWRDPALVRDVRERLLAIRGITLPRALLMLLLPVGALMLATAISLPLGYSTEQFRLADGISFSAGLLPAWLTLTAAPIVEELAWHSYGTDALAARWSIFRTSMVFAIIWAVWHMPLGLIKGYYQAEVVETGALAMLNFLGSIFPFVLIMNWLYYRCGRSILVAVVFHLVANITNEAFQTAPDTKAIQTAIFLAVAVVLVWRDRALFFARPDRSARD